MLKELLRHIRCKRLEAERANAPRVTASSREQNRGVSAHGAQPKPPRVAVCAEASLSRMLKQLNAILETRDTPHGLVVILSDDLFEGIRLRSMAYERLGRITRLLLSHSGIRLGAEVHTKGTGSAEHDERVSAERVFELMKYFVATGVHDLYTSATGLVKTDALQNHYTASGMQARRIELLVSGKAAGTKLRGASAAA